MVLCTSTVILFLVSIEEQSSLMFRYLGWSFYICCATLFYKLVVSVVLGLVEGPVRIVPTNIGVRDGSPVIAPRTQSQIVSEIVYRVSYHVFLKIYFFRINYITLLPLQNKHEKAIWFTNLLIAAQSFIFDENGWCWHLHGWRTLRKKLKSNSTQSMKKGRDPPVKLNQEPTLPPSGSHIIQPGKTSPN